MEKFYSIQGEGFHQGKAAYFIRTAGCDVGCSWCDVKESWEVEKEQFIKIDEIIEELRSLPCSFSVITGGEPLIYNMDVLTDRIHDLGVKTHLETSGTYPLSGKWDWICFSPKRFKKPLDIYYEFASELKVVISRPNDLRWAQKHAEQVNENCVLFLQPEWSVSDQILPDIIDFVKENPEWNISLQLHKYLDVR
ncbi:MAG: 7-carboxy-7-deazaguanine synthase QueE [Chitinophagales bacterium]|nr:7-carboxy-7-deazaguanine synthase QueE [Chitinophagales bacterium]